MFNSLFIKTAAFLKKVIQNKGIPMRDSRFSRKRANSSNKSLFQKAVDNPVRQQDLNEIYSSTMKDLFRLDRKSSKKHKKYQNSDYERIMRKSNQEVLDRIVFNNKSKQIKLDRIDSYIKTVKLVNLQKKDFLMKYMKNKHPEAVTDKGCIDLEHKKRTKLKDDENLIYEISRRSVNMHDQHTGDNLKKYIASTNLHDTIYISIDIEEYEVGHAITEIGITIYDPRENGGYDINGNYLSTNMPTFRKYHIIIDEEITSRNSRYVLCKKSESLFNETYILTKEETKKFLQNIWDRYFNNDNITNRGFKCALVGQSVDGDIKSLKKNFKLQSKYEFDYNLQLKSVLAKNSKKILVYDTQKISERLLFSANSVKKQLRFLNIPHGSLHNALNDSYFTLISFLTMTDINSRLNLKLDDPIELLKRYTLMNLIRKHPQKVLPMEVIYNIDESDESTPSKKWLVKSTEQLEFGIPLKTKNHMDIFD